MSIFIIAKLQKHFVIVKNVNLKELICMKFVNLFCGALYNE